MYLYHPPNDTICSQTSDFIQKLLEFSQQTLLQGNKELQLIEPGFCRRGNLHKCPEKNNQQFKGKQPGLVASGNDSLEENWPKIRICVTINESLP